MDLFEKLVCQESLSEQELNQIKSVYEQGIYTNPTQIVNDLYSNSSLYLKPIKNYELKLFGSLLNGLVMGSVSQGTSELESITRKEAAIISTTIFSTSFLIAGYYGLKQRNRNKKMNKLLTKGVNELLKYDSLKDLFQCEPYTKFWAHGMNEQRDLE